MFGSEAMTKRRMPYAVATLLLCAFGAPAAHAISPALPACVPTTSTINSPAVLPIPDNDVYVSSGITVAGVSGYVTDVEVTANLAHTFSGDLDVLLEAPDGKTISLTTDNGGTSDNIFSGTRWDDSAPPVSDIVAVSGTPFSALAPEQALANLEGSPANGTWSLKVKDDAPGVTGSLNGWSIHLTTQPVAPTVNPTVDFNAAGLPLVVPDNAGAGASSTLSVSGFQNGLRDVNLVTNIPHSFSGDIDLSLTAPSGRVAMITTDNGGTNDNVFAGTLWDDQSAISVLDATYAIGVVQTNLAPEQPLALFEGENPNGTWTLKVVDDSAIDTGTIQSWGLQISTGSCPPLTPTPAKDTRPPVIKFPNSAQKLLKQKALIVKATSDEAGTIRATASIAIKGVRKPIKLKAMSGPAVAGVARTLKFKLSKKSLRAIKSALKARRKVTATVSATATDVAGNSGSLKRKIRAKK